MVEVMEVRSGKGWRWKEEEEEERTSSGGGGGSRLGVEWSRY